MYLIHLFKKNLISRPLIGNNEDCAVKYGQVRGCHQACTLILFYVDPL